MLVVYKTPQRYDAYRDPSDMALHLAAIGVEYQEREVHDLSCSSDAEILEDFADFIEGFKIRRGFKAVDIVGATTPELRTQFLDEHTHAEPEARFFLQGSSLFYLHHEEKVYSVLCRKGSLINLPAGMPHWFDMGAKPDFKCLRFFTNPSGWVASYTGEAISSEYPFFDGLKGT